MVKKKGPAVRIRKKNAEETRKKLVGMGLMDKMRFPMQRGEHVYLPVVGGEEAEEKLSGSGLEIVRVELEAREIRKNFRQKLIELLGEEHAKGVLSSYDIVGDIVIVDIPRELEGKKTEIGEILLESEARAKVVLQKAGGREGEFRITKLAHLAGEKRTETTYSENGVRMNLDVGKVYFSPRLSHERKRLCELVKDGEKVLVPFAGVGPFALEIGKFSPCAHVVGIELNPDAVRYFEGNIRLNKLKNVEAILGDARAVVKERFVGWADRIAMPLPKDAHEFLDVAFLAAKPGCIVHFYSFVDVENGFTQARGFVEEAARKAGRKIEFVFAREVRPYSASKMQVVIDFKID